MKLINVVVGSCRVWLSRSTGRTIGFVFATLFSHMACSSAAVGEPEKDELKFGFIKLTDMAPLAVAYENGYFEDEGLYVTLEAGTIHGYCVGEPWNQQALFKGIGVPVITDYEIWKNNPEKVFGMTAEFTERYPNTSVRTVKALLRAAKWLDDNASRASAVKILSQPEYVGADYDVIANSMTGTFEYERGDKRDIPDFNVFFRYFATYPYYSDAV